MKRTAFETDWRRVPPHYLLLYLLLSAGVVVGGFFFHRNYVEQFEINVRKELTAIGELKVSELARFRQERLADAAIFFKNSAFASLVRRSLATPPDQEAQGQLRVWLTQYQVRYQYDCVFLLDTHATARIAVPAAATPLALALKPSVDNALLSTKITFQDFYRNDHDQRIYLALLVPIHDETAPDRLLGVLGLRIDPAASLYPTINRWPIPSTTAESQLFRRDGDAALCLNELRTRQSTPLSERVPLIETKRLAVMAVVGREGVVDGINSAGEAVTGYVRAVPDSPWFVVLRVETAEVFAAVTAQLRLTIVLVLALLIAIGFGLGVLWRGQLARYYQQLAEAAEALRESEERYRAVANSAKEAIITIDSPGNIVGWNRGAAQMFGYREIDVLGKSVALLAPPAWCDRHAENLRQVREGKPPPVIGKIVEMEGVRKDGGVFPLELSLATWKTARGDFYTGIIRDITERKQSEAERERLIAELRQALVEVKTLGGLLPICAGCKKIRDDKGYWSQVEIYIQERTGTKFSHGMCPECIKKYYPDLDLT